MSNQHDWSIKSLISYPMSQKQLYSEHICVHHLLILYFAHETIMKINSK